MLKQYLIASAIILIADAPAFSQNKSSTGRQDNASAQALQYFSRTTGQSFDSYLRRIRPRMISPELKRKALSALVQDDLVNPSDGGRRKLASLQPVLRYHERDGFIEMKVLRTRQATVALLAGAAVIITEPALRLLSAEELQAVVAHELAHEYFWNEIDRTQNPGKRREIELRCDGIAIFTLSRLQINPACFISAIRKITYYNENIGIATSSDSYPTLESRIEFYRLFMRIFEGL